MKYRKKPIVVEAFQYRLVGWPQRMDISDSPTQEFLEAICQKPHNGNYGGPHIHTLEGPHNITAGDWIIKGIAGEFYPCKPDIFEKTYEPVN